jgi:hypothetical protein
MVEANADDHGDVWIDTVDRIQAPAQTHLEYPNVEIRSGEHQQCRQGVVFEKCQADIAAGALNALESAEQCRLAHNVATQTNSLAVVAQMRRRKHTHLVTAGAQYGLAKSYDRSFAVRSRNRQHGYRRGAPAEPPEDSLQSVETQIDNPRMLLLLKAQPFV